MYTSCGPDRLVLAVDASRAALTAFVFLDECGMDEAVRGYHNTSLGRHAWLSDNEWTLEMSEALSSMIALPVHLDDGSTLDHIHRVVVLGEAADHLISDSSLFETLGKRGVVNKALEMIKSDVDPLFAASRGAAALAWKAEDKTRWFSCVH